MAMTLKRSLVGTERHRRSMLAAVLTLVLGAALCSSNLAYAETQDQATATETRTALTDAAPEVMQDAVRADVSPNMSTAMRADTTGGTIAAADDPATGLTVDSDAGPAITIGLPAPRSTGDAVKVGSGAIAYDNGTSNSVVVANTSGVTVLATINDRTAPERYAYPLKLAMGQTIQSTDDGGFVVLDPDGTTVALSVAPAWAKDATGASVPAHYELEGDIVTMVVAHRGGDFAYPLVADPRFVWAWNGVTAYLSRWETKQAIAYGSWAAGFTAAGRVVKVIVAVVGFPATQGAANAVVDRGWCLAINKSYWSPVPSVWPYRC